MSGGVSAKSSIGELHRKRTVSTLAGNESHKIIRPFRPVHLGRQCHARTRQRHTPALHRRTVADGTDLEPHKFQSTKAPTPFDVLYVKVLAAPFTMETRRRWPNLSNA
jgi:hypothetical protein